MTSPPLRSLVRRVLSRLERAELREPDPHFQDDYRVAWITVCNAARNVPDPHRAATYTVLGLHPDKVWPAILARRNALLGLPYEEFRSNSLPPKKPVQSVRWAEAKETARAARKESSSGKSERRGTQPRRQMLSMLLPQTGQDPMASASATAYRNSGELKSANFAPQPPRPLVQRIDASRLPPRYRVTLRHFVMESNYGPDLWVSTFRAAKAAEVSYKTMQRHIDWLEREKILHKKHAANEFISGKGLRRPATYVLNGTSAKWLAPRETYPQWQRKNRRQAPPRKGPHVIKRSSHSTSEPVAPQAAAAPVASPAPPTPPAPTIAPMRRLTPREGPKLVNEMRRLMKGVQGTINTGQGLVHIAPDDARYRPPMSQENALIAACMNLGIPYASAREHLKLCRFMADSEQPEGP